MAVLFAVTCPVCGVRGLAPCASCAAELRPSPLLPAPPALDALHAVLAYDGVGRELLARLKYRNARAALGPLAEAMAGLAERAGIDADVVTWAPTTDARRRARGFDQAELLARRVGRLLGRPTTPLLRRVAGPPQTGGSVEVRRAGPTFHCHASVPPAVVLVDDVVTTGGTMAAAATALRGAGAITVVGLAAARTPLKPRRMGADTRS